MSLVSGGRQLPPQKHMRYQPQGASLLIFTIFNRAGPTDRAR
jgi:hypothetical protein